MTATAAIDAAGLVKNFGQLRAVDGVDLNVRQGEIFGVKQGPQPFQVTVAADQRGRVVADPAADRPVKGQQATVRPLQQLAGVGAEAVARSGSRGSREPSSHSRRP